jgi:hypothetical protein
MSDDGSVALYRLMRSTLSRRFFGVVRLGAPLDNPIEDAVARHGHARIGGNSTYRDDGAIGKHARILKIGDHRRHGGSHLLDLGRRERIVVPITNSVEGDAESFKGSVFCHEDGKKVVGHLVETMQPARHQRPLQRTGPVRQSIGPCDYGFTDVVTRIRAEETT